MKVTMSPTCCYPGPSETNLSYVHEGSVTPPIAYNAPLYNYELLFCGVFEGRQGTVAVPIYYDPAY